jgi:hypothetical protein
MEHIFNFKNIFILFLKLNFEMLHKQFLVKKVNGTSKCKN